MGLPIFHQDCLHENYDSTDSHRAVFLRRQDKEVCIKSFTKTIFVRDTKNYFAQMIFALITGAYCMFHFIFHLEETSLAVQLPYLSAESQRFYFPKMVGLWYLLSLKTTAIKEPQGFFLVAPFAG